MMFIVTTPKHISNQGEEKRKTSKVGIDDKRGRNQEGRGGGGEGGVVVTTPIKQAIIDAA